MKYFRADDIELIHLQIIDATGGKSEVRDRQKLEDVISTQRQTVFGRELYKTPFEKAAALARSITLGQPFTEGNRRTGILVAMLFLERNDYQVPMDDEELEQFAKRIALDRPDVANIARWLQSRSVHARS